MKATEWYRGKMYIDEDGKKRDWEELVDEVQESAGGTCQSLNGALNEGLDYYTGGEFKDIEELPKELQDELQDDMHSCPVCGWLCYPGEFRCCEEEEDEDE